MRVYCDGVYDLFHYGHARQLEQAKGMFPHVHLIVGVASDADCARWKRPTVMTAVERAECVRHCRWVDEVVVDCPWHITSDFLAEHAIDYVCHDDAAPYQSAGHDDLYADVKRAGKFKATKRTDGVSTSDLIVRILQRRAEFEGRLSPNLPQ